MFVFYYISFDFIYLFIYLFFAFPVESHQVQSLHCYQQYCIAGFSFPIMSTTSLVVQMNHV